MNNFEFDILDINIVADTPDGIEVGLDSVSLPLWQMDDLNNIADVTKNHLQLMLCSIICHSSDIDTNNNQVTLNKDAVEFIDKACVQIKSYGSKEDISKIAVFKNIKVDAENVLLALNPMNNYNELELHIVISRKVLSVLSPNPDLVVKTR